MILLIALAGGVGAVLRFVVDSALAARNRRSYPVGTLVINVTGSALLGVLVAGAARHGPGAQELRSVLGTGLLGGYTTFSTASVELVRLARAGRGGTAAGLALAMVGLSVAAAAAGLALGSLL
ncbi:MAG: CrcB family protein [Austwickia sp.]|jgi:CrcB protein|nr:MAG: CrcB family protein [Austwickia sp.]